MILYACVAAGTKFLAEHNHDATTPLSALAAQCLRAAPRFHTLYTHTVRNRIYAFLINQEKQQQEGGEEEDPLVFFAIADESLGRANTLLFLHRLRDSYQSKTNKDFDFSSLVDEPPSLTSTSPRDLHCREDAEESVNAASDDGHEMEIAVVDVRPVDGKKSMERMWRQQVRVVVLLDVVICGVMFGIWLTMCRGFQCIRS